MSPRATHRDADHATGSTLATLAACLFVTAGALVWTSVFAAGVTLVFAGVLLLAAWWFYGLAEQTERSERGDRDRREELPSTVDVHESGRARTTRAWRAYPYHLVRAVRLRDSDAPVSHARRIAGGAR